MATFSPRAVRTALGMLALVYFVPFALYRFFPPEIKETPEAAEMARNELKRMGRMSWQEIIMLLVSFWLPDSG